MKQLGRRQFLVAAGWTAVGVTVVSGCAGVPPLPTRREVEPREAVGTWVQARPNGQVFFACPKQEMGQGIAISFAAVVAEELDVPLERVDLVLPRTRDFDEAIPSTVGSESVELQLELVAKAAASLREALVDRAAARLGVARNRLRFAEGEVLAPGGERLSIAALSRETVVLEPADGVELRSLRPANERRHVGRSVPIAELRDIVVGYGQFIDDLRLPGMLHGAIIRGPFVGARPTRAVFEKAKQKPGWVEGVVAGGIVGVVAQQRHQLDAIVSAVEVDWDEATPFDGDSVAAAYDVDRVLREDGMQHELLAEGVDLDAPWDVDLRVDVPFAAHAPIEPRCAVAEPRGYKRWRIHAATQDAFLVQKQVAFTLDVPAENVDVVSYRIGGGFGAKGLAYVEPEAAILSRAVGVPVKVRWTRSEEFHEGYHRPPSSHRVRARLKDGRVADWHHAFSGGHVIFSHAGGPKWLLGMATTFAFDDGLSRGSTPPYEFGARRIEFRDEPLPIRTGPWRGLGAGPNALAIELAMNRLAAKAGADPVEFRLRHLPDGSRLARCLRRVAKASGWERSKAGVLENGAVLGVGIGAYKGTTFAAVVARVAERNGKLCVTDVWCSHDCGLVVNPDQVAAQVEGNVMWATSSVLIEELPIGYSAVDATTFTDSPILRIDDAPRVHVDVVPSDKAPGGAGESAIVPAFGAVASAWEQATEEPIERIPVRSK